MNLEKGFYIIGKDEDEKAFNLGNDIKKYDSLEDVEKAIEKLVETLEMSNPSCHVWNVKHDNFGLLVYECEESTDPKIGRAHV